MTLATLNTFLIKHLWPTYMMLNLVLVALEKLVEQDFVCPCRPGYTEAFFSLYLLMPLLITANVSAYLWRTKHWSDSETPEEHNGCNSCRCCGRFLTCAVPSIFWLLLFFGDGRYLACLFTPPKEDHVDSIAPPPWEWCDQNRTLTDEQKHVQIKFYKTKNGKISLFSTLCGKAHCAAREQI
ncbi:hypothetical protein SRHO_G00233690 [Serrasalmus rhombeus]